MTMNMPPPYQQPYLQQSYQGYNNMPSSINPNPRYNRPQQLNIPSNRSNQLNQSMIPPQHQRSQSPLNASSFRGQNVGMGSSIPMENYSGRFGGPVSGQNLGQSMPRDNNFVRSSQGYSPSYMPPMGHPGYPQQQPYPQQPYPPQQLYQQPPNYYPQQFPQSQTPYQNYPQQQSFISPQQSFLPIQQQYIPLYSNPNYQPVNQRQNLPEQSINSNFNYQNANFDCNYSVEENLVHCVLCNQTYKTNQKKQHLELHREKVKNVNVRSVDEEQLKRLEKYNSMNRKGLMVKPIVEPDQFNVQYNPNEFVLRKVTQYRDANGNEKNTIEIQTEDNPQIGQRSRRTYKQPRRSESSSQDRPQMRRSQNVNVLQNPRNTNTRFSSEAGRQQQQIFLSDRFDNIHEGQEFKANYNASNSFRESQRRSQGSQKQGYEQSSSLRYKNAESVNRSSQMGYGKGNSLHHIDEAEEEYRLSHNENKNEIPIDKVIGQVLRESQYQIA